MTSETKTPEEGKKDPVASMAGQIRHLGNGERAALRRLDLTASPVADGVIYGMLARAGVDFSRMHDDEVDAWRVNAFAGALQSGSGGGSAHAPNRPMGRALQRAGYSEARLMQLAGQPSRERIMRAARLLGSKGDGPYDLRDLRRLSDPDPDIRAAATRDIVRDYFAAATRVAGNANTTNANKG
jgi:CRISPR system Cascade subunit CasB